MIDPVLYTDPAELLAVVDEHDQETGSERRDVIHARHLLHRAIHLFIFDPNGLLLLQQRSSHKDFYPLHWECVGGHLSPGETYDAAAMREAEEELGLQLEKITLMARLDASPATGHEFIQIYKAITAQQPAPNPAEVIDLAWFTPEALQNEVDQQGRLFSPVLLLSLRAAGILNP